MIETMKCGRDRRPEGAPIGLDVRMFVFEMAAEGFSFELQGTQMLVQPGERVGAAPHCSFSWGVIITRAPKLPAAGNPEFVPWPLGSTR